MTRVLMALSLLVLTAGCAAVPAQHVGVIETFGSVHKEVLQPGLHPWAPWTGIHRINCRTQQAKEQTQTPTNEGLIVGLDVSVVYHVDPAGAAEVYGRYGGGDKFFESVIEPEMRSSIRDVTAGYRAVDLYSSNRAQVATQLVSVLQSRLKGRPVVIEAVLLRDISLPEQLRNAISSKLASDQEAQRMEFVLRKERQEAERKRIEAQGIQDFQRIVAHGIDDRLLRWKGIEATEKLATSGNAKVVIVGGKDGLPIILSQ